MARVVDRHFLLTDLTSYRLKVALLQSDGTPVTGRVSGDLTFWRAGAGESPAVSITPAEFDEVDATNFPGLYELRLNAADIPDTLRGSWALRIVDGAGPPTAEDVYVVLLLAGRDMFGGTP